MEYSNIVGRIATCKALTVACIAMGIIGCGEGSAPRGSTSSATAHTAEAPASSAAPHGGNATPVAAQAEARCYTVYEEITGEAAELCIRPHGESGGTITLGEETWDYASTDEGVRPATRELAQAQYVHYRASGGRLVLSVEYNDRCYDERGELTRSSDCFMGFAIDPDGDVRSFSLQSGCADCDGPATLLDTRLRARSR